MQEYIEDVYIKIIFVKTAEYCADMFTKYVSGSAYKKHASDFVGTKEDIGISK